MSRTSLSVSEQDLIERLRRRDKSAMTLFYSAYKASLYHAISQLVRHPAAAEDVLQESMLKIWVNFDHYDACRGRLYTWALKLCRHAALDYLRAQRCRGSGSTHSLETCVQAALLSGVSFRPEHIGVAGWLQLLPPHHQRLIDLLYFGGCTQQEAADILGLPVGTVKTRARTALKHLAARLHVA